MPFHLFFPGCPEITGRSEGRIVYENRLAESERSDSEKCVHRQYRQGGGAEDLVQLFYRYSSGLGILVTDFELLVNRAEPRRAA